MENPVNAPKPKARTDFQEIGYVAVIQKLFDKYIGMGVWESHTVHGSTLVFLGIQARRAG